jgi:hypothetical protein
MNDNTLLVVAWSKRVTAHLITILLPLDQHHYCHQRRYWHFGSGAFTKILSLVSCLHCFTQRRH